MELATCSGERVLLRKLTLSDAPAIFEMMCYPKTTRYWRTQVKTLEECQRMLQVEYLSYFRQGLPSPYAMVYKETNQVIGLCNFNAEEEETGEIGFMLHPAFEHRGLMQEGLTLLLEQGFTTCGYSRIVARVLKGNEKSCRCLSRFGFRQEGVFKEAIRVNDERKDVIIFALLDREWEEMK